MSDFERSKYKKKNNSQNKESSNNFGRSYYGRRSPTASNSKFDKDKETKNDSIKLKQPTILLKARDHSEDTGLSPKRAAQKDNEISSSITISTNPSNAASATASIPSAELSQPPPIKSMTKSVKFLEDSTLFIENVQEFVQENSDFRVVGIVGPQGVGKSTIMNLIMQCSVDESVQRVIFNNCKGSNEEEWGDTGAETQNAKITDAERAKYEIFKIKTTEDIETNSNTTHGIDLYITSNRVIYLDCQPFLSIAVLDELIKSENKRSNLGSEFISLENSSEIQGLQLTAFLISVCHVLVAVQDYFFDTNVLRFLQTAEMLKPTHSNAEDDYVEHFPHLVLLHNKALMEDFSPKKFKLMQQIYRQIFQKSKLLKDSNLGLASCKLISSLNESNCGEPFNLFLMPKYEFESDIVYYGHPPVEELVKKLRANLLGAVKGQLTHVPLTEKTWLNYCSKVWDNVRKSSFFVEYTKLMP